MLYKMSKVKFEMRVIFAKYPGVRCPGALLYLDISGKKRVRIEVYNLTSRHFRGILGGNLRLGMTFNC